MAPDVHPIASGAVTRWTMQTPAATWRREPNLAPTTFEEVRPEEQQALLDLRAALDGLAVARPGEACSATPFPRSTDLDGALVPVFVARGFLHHHDIHHARTASGSSTTSGGLPTESPSR